jgi:3-hydroxyacyl-[acyl-carrier-protein] dehydratase
MSSSTPLHAHAIELHAEFCVTATHPCLAGHFPGNPVIPAVVLLDLLCSELVDRIATHPLNSPHLPWRLARIVTARFQSPWLPTEVLSAQIRIDLTTLRAQVQTVVAERAVATATLQFAQIDSTAAVSSSVAAT